METPTASSPARTTFRTTVLLAGKTATGVVVPAEAVAALGGGHQPLVRATIGTYSYRSRLAVRGGEHKLPISAEHRAGAGIGAGDEVEVTLELDLDPREVEVPPDLGAALDAQPGARARFEALGTSRRRALADGVASAKAPETRARRVEKAVAGLLGDG